LLHLATVQLDFVPSAVTPNSDLWTPAEPLTWHAGDFTPSVSLAGLVERVPSFQGVRSKVQAGLIELQNRRLEQILSFLERSSVDLCVFPEYAFITDKSTLRILSGFSPRMTIVAGIGVQRKLEIEALSEYSSDKVPHMSNVVAVFNGNKCHLIAKKHAADGELINGGAGPRCVVVECGGKQINLGVAICKDYLVAGMSMSELDPRPDILAIPAYSSNTDAFLPEAPRDFPRILSNHAQFGGSTIFAAGCRDRFVENGIPKPIPGGSEGILAIEWHGTPEKPKALTKKQNRVSLRSAMVSRSDGKESIDVVRAFQGLPQSVSSATDSLQEISRWFSYVQGKPRLALISDALQIFRQASNDDLMTQQLGEQLTRHLVTPETPSVMEHRRDVLRTVKEKIQVALSEYDDDVDTYKLLLNVAERYAVALGNRSATQAPERESAATDPGEVCHFSIGLGRFDASDALDTLSEQQDLLLTFARSAPRGSRVTYRLETHQEPATGNVSALYTVNFYGPSDDASKRYFTSLQRIARSVFLRGWQLYAGRVREGSAGHTVELVPNAGVAPTVREDLGFLVDVMRATGGGCVFEIAGIRTDEQPKTSEGPADPRDVRLAGEDGPGAKWFLGQLPGAIGIGLQVSLTTPDRNDALANLVGAVLYNGAEFDIVDPSRARSEPKPVYSVEIAHRVLHPPHGKIESRGLGRRVPLHLPINEFADHGEGAVIGRASAARPFVDDEVTIRIPDSSRLLHTYIIGRTGVGKTNTLKNIARYDLTRAGPVIIIDPHGDLYDYAVRHSAFRDPLVALDLGGEDVPSLNPLYLDAVDDESIEYNIEELIDLFRAGAYHEWTGPRFAELLRLSLQSLVATANEADGEWACIQDVLRLIEDRDYRSGVQDLLRRRGRSDLFQRWQLHERMRPTEQAEVEQWFVSKFGDFRRPGPLVQATSGKPSVRLEDMLRRNAAVLVKVPRTDLGNGPSQFLGSLIVQRVLRCTMNGAFLKQESPAMLLVDEFQNFVDTSFLTIIPEARKFNLGLTLANQTLSQLSSFSVHEGARVGTLLDSILGNVGNLIVQGHGRRDANALGAELGMNPEDLLRIKKHGALVVLTIDGERLDPFTVTLDDSYERPGVVPEAVASVQARHALERASAEVGLPRVDRSEASEADSLPTAGNKAGGSFFDGWLSKRQMLHVEGGEDSKLDEISETPADSVADEGPPGKEEDDPTGDWDSGTS